MLILMLIFLLKNIYISLKDNLYKVGGMEKLPATVDNLYKVGTQSSLCEQPIYNNIAPHVIYACSGIFNTTLVQKYDYFIMFGSSYMSWSCFTGNIVTFLT